MEYKNRLLSELSVITGEELADIETISGNLRQCVEGLDSMIEDMAMAADQ